MRLFLFLALSAASLMAADAPTPVDEAAQQLAKVRRIYISILTGGDTALQLRDLLMTSLQSTKQFIITEDEDKADAVLKGAGDDQVFNETHQSSEGINAHTQIGGGVNGNTKSSSGLRYAGVSIGENESRHTQERKHEAMVTVRLVNRDGDVIWSGTAESQGGKFLGASADVASKIAKDLAADYKNARKLVESQKLGKP